MTAETLSSKRSKVILKWVRVWSIPWVLTCIGTCIALSNAAAADEAIERIRRDRAAGRIEAIVEAGRVQFERGAYISAIRMISEAIKKGARPKAYKVRGQAYLALGSYQEAIDDLTRYMQSGLGGAEDLTLRGDAYSAQGNYVNAFNDYNSAIGRDSQGIDAYLGRGLMLLTQERYAAAIHDFQTALQADARNIEALTNLGYACMLADLPNAAREYFQKAMEVETSAEWKGRLENWLNELPESSPFEQKIGGLLGFLSHSAKAKTVGGAPGQLPNAVDEVGGSTQDEQSYPQKKHMSEGLARLRNGLNRQTDETPPLSGKISGGDMGFKWTFAFQAKGRHVTGTLRIVGPAGFDEMHHCTGTYDRGFVDVSDRTGYRFHGRVTEDLRLVGTLNTNHGRSYAINTVLQE